MTLLRFTLQESLVNKQAIGDLVVDPQFIGSILTAVTDDDEPVAIIHMTNGLPRAVVRDVKRTAQSRWIAATGGVIDEED